MSLQENFCNTRPTRHEASEFASFSKLWDQPDIISFAGGIPDPDLFSWCAPGPVPRLTPNGRVFSGTRPPLAMALSGSRWRRRLRARIISTSEGHKTFARSGSRAQRLQADLGTVFLATRRTNIRSHQVRRHGAWIIGQAFLFAGDYGRGGAGRPYWRALGAFNAYEPRAMTARSG